MDGEKQQRLESGLVNTPMSVCDIFKVTVKSHEDAVA